MAYDQETGTVNIRQNLFDKVVKGFAEASYKFKQAVTISTTGAWNNYFFREQPDALASPAQNSIEGVPRGAAFPQAYKTWERVNAIIKKYGLEANIHWEDILADEIDVQERMLFRIAEGVAKSVDDEIWDSLTENRSPTNIQNINISVPWNASSAQIVNNLLQAVQLIAENNYDASDCMAFVSPKDFRYMMNYMAEKGAQWQTLGAQVAQNGKMAEIAGVKIIVSNSVTASYALVVKPQRVATWKQLVPLTTITKDDQGISRLIRSYELGVTQLTDPKCAVLLTGTQGAGA